MKTSIYKSIIPVSEKSCLLYSAASDKFIICKKELLMLLKKPATEIRNINPAFYEQLCEGGFLVADEVDEVKQMIDLGVERCTNLSSYHLIINPTMNCNFKCWYCYENHSSYTKMSVETVNNVKQMIARICADKIINTLHLSFFGGEPLLYYNDTVRPIINAIRDNKDKYGIKYNIHFTTNGYLITDYILQHLAQTNDPKSFQITLDGHREKHNKVRFTTTGIGSYDRIISNLKKILGYQMEVLLRINFTTDNIDSIPLILDDLRNLSEEERKYLRIDFQKVWQDHTIEHDNKTLNETIDTFKVEFESVSDHYNRIDSLRMPCYGDLINECVINYNGDIYKCTARDFTPNNRLGVLTQTGEINWERPEFIKQRLLDKFNKTICNRCRIFPICGGGCAQTSSEAGKNNCINCKNELEKDKIIIARFYDRIVKHRQNESAIL